MSYGRVVFVFYRKAHNSENVKFVHKCKDNFPLAGPDYDYHQQWALGSSIIL